jgi:phage protein D
MIEKLFAATAPVFEVDGQVRGELARDIVRLEVEESTDGLKALSARLVALGPKTGSQEEQLLYLDGDILDFGKSLEVSLGSPPQARVIFRGRISALEASFEETHDPEVVFFAEDRLMDLRMTRRMRTYENMTDAQIAEDIAAEHGLAVEADADGPAYDVVQQWNLSDLAFLRERARLIQAEVWMHKDTLHFKTRQRRGGPELTLVRGNQLISVQARADLAHQRTAIHVSGYDANLREGIDEEAAEEAIQAEISSGRTGPAILASAFGARVSHRVREAPLASAEAARWARAEMQRRSRGFVQIVGVAASTPDLVVGSRLTLERVGRPFNGGGYYVTHVRHTYDLSTGHRTCFEAERPTIEETRS